MINLVLGYVLETLIFIIILSIGSLILLWKNKTLIWKFIGITSIIFVIVFFIIFILEKPQIQTGNIQIIEAKTTNLVEKPKVFYHFHDITDKMTIAGNVDLNKVGEYEVEYEIKTLLSKYNRKLQS